MKNNHIIRLFLPSFLILTLVLSAIFSGLFYTLLKDYYFNLAPVVFAFVVVISCLSLFFVLKAGILEAKKFPRRYMAVHSMKLFVYLLVIVLFVVLNKDEAIPFLVFFLLNYLIFLIYEVSVVKSILDKLSEKKKTIKNTPQQ